MPIKTLAVEIWACCAPQAGKPGTFDAVSAARTGRTLR